MAQRNCLYELDLSSIALEKKANRYRSLLFLVALLLNLRSVSLAEDERSAGTDFLFKARAFWSMCVISHRQLREVASHRRTIERALKNEYFIDDEEEEGNLRPP